MTATLQIPRTAGTLDLFPIVPFGFEGGYGTEGDVLPRINQTADGVDLNRVWGEFETVLRDWNTRSSSLAGLLSYTHVNSADPIPAKFTQNIFERASEFGEPVAIRPGSYTLVGYDFEDYDTATRFTWKFLRDATVEQVRAVHNEALAADGRLVTSAILSRLFDPAASTNDQGTPVYGLFSGDGQVPAPFAGQTFDGTHTHYVRSGNTTIDSGDVEGAIRLVREHGHGLPESGQRLVLLVNPNQGEHVMSWAKGAENENSAVAKYDAIPSAGSPAFVSDGPIVGSQAPAEFNGVTVSGSYGPALVVESYFVPNNYFAVVATSGPNSPDNAIGVRQHPTPLYQGLRMIPGAVPGYPLQDSFYTRGFGVGTRWRGAAAVCQITPDAEYTPPTIVT